MAYLSHYIVIIGIPIMSLLFAIKQIDLIGLLISLPLLFGLGFGFHMKFEVKREEEHKQGMD